MQELREADAQHAGRPRRGRWVAIVIAVTVVASVAAALVISLRPDGEKRYESVADLVETLNDEGVECAYGSSEQVSERIIGTRVTYDLGHCTMPGQERPATIWVFPTDKDASTVRSEFGVTGRWIVGDTNWDVSAPSRAAQKSIQDAIGGHFASNI